MKLKLTKKSTSQLPKKYVRVIFLEGKKGHHRFVENSQKEVSLEIGIGRAKNFTTRHFTILVRSIIKAAKSHQVEHLTFTFDELKFSKIEKEYSKHWLYSTLAENLLIASYEFKKYKTTKSKKAELKEVVVTSQFSQKDRAAFVRGITVGEYVNKARDIANTPGDDLTPSELAKTAVSLAKGTKVSVKVLDPKAIKKEGLHALWAVGKGADDLPRFIVMEYWGLKKPSGKNKDKKLQPLILVGKGITYDTGGLNVKPSGSMHEMHLDMSGGSSVMASIVCAAKLKLKKNIVAIIPAAENAVSEKSMRAGDIIKSHSGKTIEVLHTDAEGRLVLADGLSYASKYEPRAVLDVATLTGAALVALGQKASAIMTKDQKLQAELVALGEESGDLVWPLPLWDEYVEPLKDTRADIANIQPSFSRFGGTIEGAAFLSYFAPKCPWAHLDIAPRMESIPSDQLAKGSTGEPVRLLVSFLEKH